MQLQSSPSAPCDTIADASTAAPPGLVATPVEPAVTSSSVPVNASGAAPGAPIGPPVASPNGPTETQGSGADNDRDPIFGIDTFMTKPIHGTVLQSQGVFATFHCPQLYGHDLITEKLEYQRVMRAPWEEKDQFLEKRSITTEIYEADTVAANDLPDWARALDGPAQDLSTMEGGAERVSRPADDAVSAITTPFRSPSVESITTLFRSPSVQSVSTPTQPSGDGGIPTPGQATVNAVAIIDSTAQATPGRVRASFNDNTSAPETANISAVRSTAAAADIPASADSIPNAPVVVADSAVGIDDISVSGNLSAPAIAVTPVKTPTHRPGMFELMGVPKPVLDRRLNADQQRRAYIEILFGNMKKSDAIAKAIADMERSPTPATPADDNPFSAFTPNTTRLFDQCEDLYNELTTLPSLTPLFQAAFGPCEHRVVATMNASNDHPMPGPTISTAGPSTAVTAPSKPRRSSRKKVTSASVSVSASAGPSSGSASRKRQVYEIEDDDDEVEIVSFVSAAKAKGKGKGKSPAGSKKHKGA